VFPAVAAAESAKSADEFEAEFAAIVANSSFTPTIRHSEWEPQKLPPLPKGFKVIQAPKAEEDKNYVEEELVRRIMSRIVPPLKVWEQVRRKFSLYTGTLLLSSTAVRIIT
jgi:hypothetical protein